MGCNQSHSLGCPKCGSPVGNKKDFMMHWQREHELNDNDTATTRSTPKSNESGFHSIDIYVPDIEHSDLTPDKAIVSQKSSLEGCHVGASLIDPCEKIPICTEIPKIVLSPTDDNNLPEAETGSINDYKNADTQLEEIQSKSKSLPRVGDKVLAMWVHTKWQYFHATICRFIPDQLQYEVDWDDQDTTGRIVDYFNLALDKSPSPKDISVGSIVLFPQGYYYISGEEGAKEEVRWHQGKVSHIDTAEDGTKWVSGCHTKGKADGKLTTYKGYKYRFERLNLSDLRVAPNIFDILDDNVSYRDETVDELDINVSCTMSDSPKAIDSQENEKPPTQYH